jgi:hypothetical protein
VPWGYLRMAGTKAAISLYFSLLTNARGEEFADALRPPPASLGNDFVTWAIQQAPPLFALNADGKILCIPELSMSSLQDISHQLLFKSYVEAKRTYTRTRKNG